MKKNEWVDDDWDIKISTDDIVKKMLNLYKFKWENLKILFQPQWNEMNNIEQEDYLSRLIDLNNVKKIIMREKIGNEIALNIKEYCFIEILENIRHYVYESIKDIEEKINEKAYIIISGGEPLNKMFNLNERQTTLDIDTKIIPKFLQKCDNYPISYKDEIVKLINYLWQDVYPDVYHNLEQKYPYIYNDLNKILLIPEIKAVGVEFFKPTSDLKSPFKKRFSRLLRKESVILFAIDLVLKKMIDFENNFILKEVVYPGFLDSPIIYNPNEIEHLYKYVIKISPKDYLIKSTNHPIYEHNFLMISPEYAVHDTERLVRTQDRPEKIDKDRKRFKLLMDKFGSEEYVFKHIPKVKDITLIPIHEYSIHKFPKHEILDLVSDCKPTDYPIKFYNWNEDTQKISSNPLHKILSNVITYNIVQDYLNDFVKLILDKKIFPIFLENFYDPKDVHDFLLTFYFSLNKSFKNSQRNSDIFKLNGERYMCESYDDENCYEECSESNQTGCSIFGFKDLRKIDNLSIGQKSEWYNAWINFLLDILIKNVKSISHAMDSKIQRELLIALNNDYFIFETKLSNQHILDYFLIQLFGIEHHMHNPKVFELVSHLIRLKHNL